MDSGTIPAEISHVKSLEHIYLSNNQLSGTIPPELGKMQHLTTLGLYSNQLSAGNHSSFVAKSLEHIDLSHNQLSGAIPPELGEMQHLSEINFSWNQLSGTIPAEISHAKSLEHIDLSHNQLSGAIPPELGKMQHLSTLNLSWNQLSGAIPPELGKMQHLSTLNLSWNQLSGTIPAEISHAKCLGRIYFSHNQLSGTIPPELGKLQNSRILDLSWNQLSGEDDMSLLGIQEEGTTPVVDIASAGDDKSTISMMKPQPEKGEGVEEAKSSGMSRREGKVGDRSSEAEEKSSEIGLPKGAQEQPADEKSAGEVKLDEEPNPPEEREQTVLAEWLGTKARTYRDPSSGVELILEDGSLEEEIKNEVVVKQEIRYITCSNERDTSRTHEELLARASDDGIGELAFLAMPIIHGPSEAVFSPNKPARLRFFAGYSEDIQQEIEDEGGDDYSNDAVEGYLRKIYEPLISADGINWRMLPPFEVDFVLSPDDGEQVWLESPLYHFSEGAIGKLIPKLSDDKLPNSDYKDDSTFEFRMPLLKRLMNRGRVMFGNATKDELIFYACKKEDTVACERRMAVGFGAGGATVTGEKGQNTTTVSHGIDHTFKHKIKAGRYKLVEMPKEGNWVQKQILCAVFKPEKAPGKPQSEWSQYFLIKSYISTGWVFATLPGIINDWRSEGKDPTRRLDYNAPLRKVRESLLDC